jgi:hypothetical protein
MERWNSTPEFRLPELLLLLLPWRQQLRLPPGL